MKRKTTKAQTAKSRSKAKPATARLKKKSVAKTTSKTSQIRKATSAKAAKPKTNVRARAKVKEVLGEGNYTASRNFDREQADFVRRNKGRIAKLGKAAEKSLEGAEGQDLEQAAERARAHSRAPDEER